MGLFSSGKSGAQKRAERAAKKAREEAAALKAQLEAERKQYEFEQFRAAKSRGESDQPSSTVLFQDSQYKPIGKNMTADEFIEYRRRELETSAINDARAKLEKQLEKNPNATKKESIFERRRQAYQNYDPDVPSWQQSSTPRGDWKTYDPSKQEPGNYDRMAEEWYGPNDGYDTRVRTEWFNPYERALNQFDTAAKKYSGMGMNYDKWTTDTTGTKTVTYDTGNDDTIFTDTMGYGGSTGTRTETYNIPSPSAKYGSDSFNEAIRVGLHAAQVVAQENATAVTLGEEADKRNQKMDKAKKTLARPRNMATANLLADGAQTDAIDRRVDQVTSPGIPTVARRSKPFATPTAIGA